MTPTDRERLEERLRVAGATMATAQLPVEAWQEHQQRLAADRGRRTSSRRRLLAAAAAVVLVAGVIGASALIGDQGRTTDPATGSGSGGDPWAPENILGEPVVAETLTQGGQRVRHEIVLTDTTGDGPDLCDQYLTADGSSGAGGCARREPTADDPGVAFDWLTGTEGGGDLRGVTAAVDDRVQQVQVWMSNGDEVRADLHPTGWEGTRMFALTVPADGPVPQRLVATSDANGTVLQAIDLRSTFGDAWAPAASACTGSGVGVWPFPDSGGPPGDVTIGWGTSDALVTGRGSSPVCLDGLATGALAGWLWQPAGRRLVVAVAPEVITVELLDGERLVAEIKPSTSEGSPLKAVVFRGLSDAVLPGARLVANDTSGHELDRAFVNQPASP